jgi:hypothetical protein
MGARKGCSYAARVALPHIALKTWIVTDATGTLEILFGRPREALRSRPRRRPRPRIRPRGVMEFWSVGVLRQFGIAPRVRGVGSAFRAISLVALPRAEALGYDLEPLRGKTRQTPRAQPGAKPWAQP